jgi:transposase
VIDATRLDVPFDEARNLLTKNQFLCSDRFGRPKEQRAVSQQIKQQADNRTPHTHVRILPDLSPTRSLRIPRAKLLRTIGAAVGKTKWGKGTKLMAVADGAGAPIAVYAASASPHEVTLAQDPVEQRFTDDTSKRLIGDRAYDSDPLDAKLAQQGVELIAPHRENRSRPATQDGRALRRYQRRWKVKRLFACLQNFRRLVVRYEYHVENFLDFVLLGCMLIVLRRHF